MENNKKHYIIISIISILSILIIFTININMFNNYTLNYNKAIINLVDRYDLDKTEVFNVINEEANDEDMFAKYGIDVNEESLILYNTNSIVYINCILASLVIVILLIYIKSISNKTETRIKQLTYYVNEINKKNYSLNIEDNKDSNISFLQNEIYKTMVSLNELATNSVNDKVSIKNNLDDITHQIKTPLTSIIINLDNLLLNPVITSDKETVKIIKTINKETDKINTLIKSLLKLSKFDTNTIEFTSKDVDIKDLVKEAISNVSVIAELSNINLVVNGNTDIKNKLDIKWQCEALTNILKNACEHGASNIEVSYGNNNIYSYITIKDNGRGIELNEIKNIFKRFYKSSNSNTNSAGIGLSLAKTIIEKENGNISVHTTSNKETVFTIKYFLYKEENK